jgi:type III secretion protein C
MKNNMPTRPLLHRRHLIVAVAGLFAAKAYGAAIPWGSVGNVAPIVARDTPMTEFIQSLVAPLGLNVVVSQPAAQKLVQGRFSGDARRVFDQVVRTYALLPYFDGSTLYIFASTEVQRRTIGVSQATAERVIATLNQLRLHDGRYNVFSAVPASGVIQVTGARPFVDQVAEVVRSVQNTGFTGAEQIAVYPLKHAFAWDVTLTSGGRQIVVPGIATLIRNLMGVAPVQGRGQRPRVSVQRLRGRGFASGTESDAYAPSGDESGSAAAQAAEDADAPAPMVSSSGPMVTAEIRSNSVVVRDTPDRLPRYAELIRALDVEPLMVELEATIVDVNSDRLVELGVNWRGGDGRNEVRLGTGGQDDLRLRGPTVNDVTPVGRGLTWSTILDRANLIARINVLAADGDARVVSRAQIATLANVESAISSAQTAFVRVGGFQEVDLFPVTASTSVRITPQVFTRGDRRVVNMSVSIRDGKFTRDAQVDQIPLIQEVALSTNGMVTENQTFVIGGLRQESSTSRTDKVPLLGDIPVLGTLFRTTRDEVLNAERLFLLTPRVLTLDRLMEVQTSGTEAAQQMIKPPPKPRRPTHEEAADWTRGS